MSDAPAPLLPAVFRAAARWDPSALALDIPPGAGRPARVTLTYAALGARAADLAAALAPWIAGEGLVAVLLPRHDADLFAGELAITSVGAAWVALDPLHPDAHLAWLLGDARPVAVLTDGPGRARLGRLGVVAPERVLDVTSVGRAAPLAPAAPPPWLAPSTLAYVIYTSGTTGRPKGVCIEHGSIANLVASDRVAFDLGPGDRVAQGSAHTYDSSLEETWLAWAAGATVVVLDDDAVRLGPDLVPWLRAERITVLCPPPTLLRTMALEDPLRALPDLRLLYVGGEALPRDVADRWAPGRRLVNGYGPTECTVTTLRAEVRAGAPITIGAPIPGTTALVLDDALEVVADGQSGELAIGGVGLARGYLGRPDLTRERFLDHPQHGRIYRTGDRVTRDPTGALCYEGRLDAQVKVRGHRIELEAVEAHLAALPGVQAAACRLDATAHGEVLVGFVVPADAQRPPALHELAARLRRDLPAPMVPAHLALLDRLPVLSSGKLDRRALPAWADDDGALPRATPEEPPAGPLETHLATVLGEVLGRPGRVGRRDDFFHDLGGDSVRAALAISRLRQTPASAALTVRDLYEARDVATLAERLGGRAALPAARLAAAVAPRGRPRLVTAAQGAWLLAELVVGAGVLWATFFLVLPFLLAHLGLVGTLLVVPPAGLLLFALYAPLAVFLLAGMKRVLIGRYRPGRVPVWSGAWWRHWLLTHLARIVPWTALAETVFLNAALRVLGARIGRDVHLHRGVDVRRGGWDLLEIGDGACVGRDAALRLTYLERGHLVVGPVRLGAGCVLETRAGVDAHARVGPGGHLTALSWLPGGVHLPAGERWSGVPARPVPPEPAVEGAVRGRPLGAVAHGVAALLQRFLQGTLLGYLPFALLVLAAPGVDAERVLAGLAAGWGDPAFTWGLAALLVLARLLRLPLSALVVRGLGRVPEGNVARSSLQVLRLRAVRDAVSAAGTVLSGTLFWPPWLRAAGMRVGAGTEISTIDEVLPARVTLGAGDFLADGIYLGAPRVRDGVIEVRSTHLGDGVFLGNHVVVPAGTHLPAGVLVGVGTVADGEAFSAGTSWFGHPPLELPRREVVGMDRRLTHEPGAARYTLRLGLESLRALLPVVPALVLMGWLAAVSAIEAVVAWPLYFLVALPAVTAASGLALLLLVLALKWTLLGRVRPGQHGLWSAWCSRWDLVYVAWGAWCRGVLAAFEGTLFLTAYLRAMGMRIGRRVVLGGGFAQVVDPDMITIEDDATVNGLFQAHTFEDRVLKIDRVRIGRGATVGGGAVLFYGAELGAGTHVLPQAVVMKREQLLAGHTYAGCPTAPHAPVVDGGRDA